MDLLDSVKMIDFQQRGDDRGYLVVIEENKEIPFELKRIFYMYGSDTTVVRGQHANRKTEFVLVNVAGSSKVLVKDGLGNEREFVLDKAHSGIYIPRMIWKDMYDFSSDSILLVLASELYDNTEYIRDYDEYTRVMRKEYRR